MSERETCPQVHESAKCRLYGSAYNHGIIRALWQLAQRERRSQPPAAEAPHEGSGG